MGTTKERVKGAAQEATGKVKKAVGAAADRPDVESEGRVDEALGKARQELAKAAEKAKEKIGEVAGVVADAVGKLTGHEDQQSGGKSAHK